MKKLFLFLFTALFINSVFASMSMFKTEEEKYDEDCYKKKRKTLKRQNAFCIESPESNINNDRNDHDFGENRVIYIINAISDEQLNEKFQDISVNETNDNESQKIIWESKISFENSLNESGTGNNLQFETEEEQKNFEELFLKFEKFGFSPGLKVIRKKNIKKKKRNSLKKNNSFEEMYFLSSDENDSFKKRKNNPEM